MSIDFYKEFGPLGYLANYSNHSFFDNGIFYKTVEHYYQAHKFADKKLFNRVLEAETPKEASNIGRDRNNIRREDFDKLKVMYQGLYLKFSQNKDIRAKLIETRNEPIREMTVKESYWGIGPNLDGENHIGILLMQVRENIKKDLLNSIIEKCKNKKVYIIGHHNPDLDSVLSAYLLSKVLKEQGVDAIFSVRDKNYLDQELMSLYLKEEPIVVDDYSDKEFILVDHNNLDGIPHDNVIASIDHHRITGEVEDLIEIEYASTGLLIYDLFKDKHEFTKEEQELVALTVLTDTDYLASTRFSKEDKKLYQGLDVQFNPQEMKKKYLKTTDFSKKLYEVFHTDYKEYDHDDIKIKRSLIKSFTKEKEEFLPKYMIEMHYNDINLIIWCDYEKEETYICYNNELIKHPFFTTSTNLNLKYLEEQGLLSPINKTYCKKSI